VLSNAFREYTQRLRDRGFQCTGNEPYFPPITGDYIIKEGKKRYVPRIISFVKATKGSLIQVDVCKAHDDGFSVREFVVTARGGRMSSNIFRFDKDGNPKGR